jgi:hypothetical protein
MTGVAKRRSGLRSPFQQIRPIICSTMGEESLLCLSGRPGLSNRQLPPASHMESTGRTDTGTWSGKGAIGVGGNIHKVQPGRCSL